MPDPAPKLQMPPTYRRLPGRGRSLVEYVTLYAAPDHLLHISSTGFSESYRRFYFRDIHAITVRKTVAGPLLTALWGALAFFCLIGAVSTGGVGGWIGWGTATGIFLAILLGNIFRGPTCECTIHTAVQSRRLYSINRLRRAERFLSILRPLLLAAQGQVAQEELRQRIDAARQSAFTSAAPPVIGQSPR